MSNSICGEEMIIDRNEKFIFIHNPRTGGTAISKSLINAEWRADEKELSDHIAYTRLFNLNVRPRRSHYQTDALPHAPHRERLVSGLQTNTNFNVLETVYSDVPNLFFSHHDHLSLYSCTSEHLLNEYKYKFVCVRDPWSRLVSYYTKIKKAFDDITTPDTISPHLPFTFSSFIDEIMRNRFDNNLNYLWEVPQTYWTYGVDEVIRYDELSEKWEDILQSCGISYRPLLGSSKETNVSQRKKCSEYYDIGEHLVEKVAHCFAEEIALFNFDYNGGL
jgi:hypothetical protein